MTGSGKPNLEDRTDRYVRRELSPEEARQLAQASLDSPSWLSPAPTSFDFHIESG